jgi:ribosomal protein L29
MKRNDDLRKLSIEELKKKRDEVEFMLIQANKKLIKAKIQVTKRKSLKKMFARIYTIIKEKQKTS